MNKTFFHPSFASEITAPSSKSHLQRLILCSLLSKTAVTLIFDGELSDDILAAINCVKALGATVEINLTQIKITPPDRFPQTAVLDCASSGAALRFFLPLCAALGIKTELNFSYELSKRPVLPLVETLNDNGANIILQDNKILVQNKLTSSDFSVPGNISSQFVSGLLFACTVSGGKINLLSPLKSSGYVDLTVKTLADFGVFAEKNKNTFSLKKSFPFNAKTEYFAEGDWSNSAFGIVAGVIGTSPVKITGLNPNSAQPDKQIIEILKKTGAKITVSGNTVTAFPSSLSGISIDAGDIPDIVLPLSIAAALAKGTTKFFGVERLKFKETDRINSAIRLINSLGGRAEYLDNTLFVHQSDLTGGKIEDFNDHRTVMSGVLAATVCKDKVEISGCEAVNKSYPAFFKTVK